MWCSCSTEYVDDPADGTIELCLIFSCHTVLLTGDVALKNVDGDIYCILKFRFRVLNFGSKKRKGWFMSWQDSQGQRKYYLWDFKILWSHFLLHCSRITSWYLSHVSIVEQCFLCPQHRRYSGMTIVQIWHSVPLLIHLSIIGQINFRVLLLNGVCLYILLLCCTMSSSLMQQSHHKPWTIW